jgi:dTDP-4-amino-4,6-dideoxyglucose formyltransferase
MYNNILIISDNIQLCKKVKKLISKQKNEKTNFRFSISPFSNKLVFTRELEEHICVYNMKNRNDVEIILNNYDLIISIHCKQFFPPEIINNIRCINIHPGYNPINRGWYPQVFAICNNLPVGATIHEMDNQLDNGNIIDRALVNQEIIDTSEKLYNKIIKKEIELLSKNLGSIIRNDYGTIKPEVEGQLKLKSDFKDLCRLDLSEKSTILQLINRLRALTHGNFKNAFFIDPFTGKKVFVSIKLQYESE